MLACNGLNNEEESSKVVARVGEQVLRIQDLPLEALSAMTPLDSTAFAISFINRWASRQLLFEKSKVNLTAEEINSFNQLVEQYRTDLLTSAYKEALLDKVVDSTITNEQLFQFYNNNRENFRLEESIYQLRYIQLPVNFLNPEVVIQRFENYNKADRDYLDSIALQFTKLHLNDSLWVGERELKSKIPFLSLEENQWILNKSQSFKIQDTTGIYLGKLISVIPKAQIAPLHFVSENVSKILMNQRRFDAWRNMEKELLSEALEKKELIIYD